MEDISNIDKINIGTRGHKLEKIFKEYRNM